MRRTGLTIVVGLILPAAALAAGAGFMTIFDGSGPSGWLIGPGKPLPARNVQADGLNPHDSGGYVVFHEKKYGDFVFDFDYKLTRRCNSGVFVRVGSMDDPVMTGLEVALDDTRGHGRHDPGAFYDLVAPRVNVQKPVGQWNHMTVTATGPKIEVVLNGQTVSAIDLDEWTEPGKRPDGTRHKFNTVRIKDFNRPGYVGFQDHGSDCWFKNVKIKEGK
jgi:hypothetical protein